MKRSGIKKSWGNFETAFFIIAHSKQIFLVPNI